MIDPLCHSCAEKTKHKHPTRWWGDSWNWNHSLYFLGDVQVTGVNAICEQILGAAALTGSKHTLVGLEQLTGRTTRPEDIRKKKCASYPLKPFLQHLSPCFKLKPFINYRDRLAAAFRVIKVKVRSLTAQTLCWKSFCSGWNKTQTSVGHSAIELLLFTQNTTGYLWLSGYSCMHAKCFCLFNTKEFKKINWFFLAALQLITCTLTQKIHRQQLHLVKILLL